MQIPFHQMTVGEIICPGLPYPGLGSPVGRLGTYVYHDAQQFNLTFYQNFYYGFL